MKKWYLSGVKNIARQKCYPTSRSKIYTPWYVLNLEWLRKFVCRQNIWEILQQRMFKQSYHLFFNFFSFRIELYYTVYT